MSVYLAVCRLPKIMRLAHTKNHLPPKIMRLTAKYNETTPPLRSKIMRPAYKTPNPHIGGTTQSPQNPSHATLPREKLSVTREKLSVTQGKTPHSTTTTPTPAHRPPTTTHTKPVLSCGWRLVWAGLGLFPPGVWVGRAWEGRGRGRFGL